MITGNGYRRRRLINGRSAKEWVVSLPAIGRLGPWLQLAKFPVCLLVAFSTLFGCVLAEPEGIARAVTASVGMLLLACGGATLNSLQEVGLDASMVRTKDRPLPSGRLKAGQAAVLAPLLIAAGLIVLYLGVPSLLAASLGLAAVVLYNLLYTTLKTKTLIAIIPGAMSGALPPYIGWVAAGGDPLSITALWLGVLFILWQVPHALLILLNHRHDYLDTPIPSLVKLFSETSLKRLFIIWIGAFFVVLLLVSGLPIRLTVEAKLLVWISVPLMFCVFCKQISCQKDIDYYYLFIQLNLYLFLIMALVVGERLYFS